MKVVSILVISWLISNDQHIISPYKINTLSKQSAGEKKEFNMHLLVFVIPGVLEEEPEDYTRRKQSLSMCWWAFTTAEKNVIIL